MSHHAPTPRSADRGIGLRDQGVDVAFQSTRVLARFEVQRAQKLVGGQAVAQCRVTGPHRARVLCMRWHGQQAGQHEDRGRPKPADKPRRTTGRWDACLHLTPWPCPPRRSGSSTGGHKTAGAVTHKILAGTLASPTGISPAFLARLASALTAARVFSPFFASGPTSLAGADRLGAAHGMVLGHAGFALRNVACLAKPTVAGVPRRARLL